jgi:diacylglycerol kinase (ATP)
MHNPTAGSADHSIDELIDAIESGGHEVVQEVSHRGDLVEALKQPCELVVAAGGDGTVGAAAEVLIGSSVPLAVLPLGTANNIARTLAIPPDRGELISAWSHSVPHPFDAATCSLGGETRRFFECCGFGVFPETMRGARRLPDRENATETLAQHLALVRALVATGTAHHYSVSVDGFDRSGEYLLVEVMNVPYLGPRLVLAPLATPDDGLLDVVLLRARDRNALLEHIDAVRGGVEATLRFPVERGRHIAIACLESDVRDVDYHRDGHLEQLGPAAHGTPIEVRIEPAALRVLRAA